MKKKKNVKHKKRTYKTVFQCVFLRKMFHITVESYLRFIVLIFENSMKTKDWLHFYYIKRSLEDFLNRFVR